MLSNHTVHTKINFHFKHITSTTPTHIEEIHKVKKIQSRKPTLPIKNHVLYEFCPSEPEKKPKDIDNVSGLVEYVVDHIDLGDVYHSSEENLHYNPMNFSVRHYISSK